MGAATYECGFRGDIIGLPEAGLDVDGDLQPRLRPSMAEPRVFRSQSATICRHFLKNKPERVMKERR